MNINTYDAQAALGFVLSQTSHIETQVNETVYPDIQYPALIPVDMSANPFAQTVTYFSSDKFGSAEWINGNSDDIPLAGTERTKFQTTVHTAGIGYGYGWEELGVAMSQGINLLGDDAAAARRSYEEMVDSVAISGDTSKNFEGLINNSAVTAAAVTTGTWGTATAIQMLGDVNDLITAQGSGTLYTSIADTILMSPGKLNKLATTVLTNTDTNVLSYLMKYNVYTQMTGQPLTIRAVRGLETAGAGAVERMVAYRRAPEVLKLHLPMPHRFLTAVADGPLSIVVPGVFRLGGLDIRRPKEVRYSDGI